MIIFHLAFRNLKAHARQTLAALISLIMGAVALNLFSGYYSFIFQMYEDYDSNIDMKGDVIIEKRGASTLEGKSDIWSYSLNKQEQVYLKNILSEKKDFIAMRVLNVVGSIETRKSSFVFVGKAYDVPEGAALRGDKWQWNTFWGLPLQKTSNPEGQMILGRRLGQMLGCLPEALSKDEAFDRQYLVEFMKEGKERPFLCGNQSFQLTAMTEHGQVNAIDLEVSGLFDGGYKEVDLRHVQMSLNTAQKFFDTDKVSYVALRLPAGLEVKKEVEALNDRFSKEGSPLVAKRWQEHPLGDTYRRAMSLLGVFRNFVTAIVVFVASLSVFNTLIKLVKERTREIGMLRSLGFKSDFIQKLFIVESAFLGLLSGVLGAILSAIGSLFLNHSVVVYRSGLFSYYSPFRIETGMLVYLQSSLLLACIAIFAAWLAVQRVSRENIAGLLVYA